MKHYKIKTQEFNIGWKDEEPMGNSYTNKIEAESFDIALKIAISSFEYGESIDDKDFEEMYGKAYVDIQKAVADEGGFWDCDSLDMGYYGRPEPNDGYATSGTFVTIEEYVPKVYTNDELLEKAEKKVKGIKEKLAKAKKVVEEIKWTIAYGR